MPPGWIALHNKPPASTPSLAGETTFLFIGKKKAMVFFSMFTHTKAALFPFRMRKVQPNDLLFPFVFNVDQPTGMVAQILQEKRDRLIETLKQKVITWESCMPEEEAASFPLNAWRFCLA